MAKAEAPKPAPVAVRDPDTAYGLQDDYGHITYSTYGADGKSWRLKVSGQNWEHTHEDADGVWVFVRK